MRDVSPPTDDQAVALMNSVFGGSSGEALQGRFARIDRRMHFEEFLGELAVAMREVMPIPKSDDDHLAARLRAGLLDEAVRANNPITVLQACAQVIGLLLPVGCCMEVDVMETKMTNEQIKHMVNRFLGWKLPESFSPDGGISFKKTFNDHLPNPPKNEPTGTNLFDVDEASAMVRYMIEGIPAVAKMGDKEAIDMMQRCKQEIVSLKREIERLRPKAEAYDSVAQVLALLPRQSMGMGEDIVWILDKRIREIEQAAVAQANAA